MENGKRILYAEVLRVVAAFSVVFQHTASSAWYSLPVDSDKFIFVNVFNSISRFGVGVFFMISGAFLLDPNRNYTPATILKKKLPQLLLLLIVWGIFFSILNTAIAQGDLKNYLTSPLQIFISPPTHLWFLYVLAGLYALTPALRVFTKNASRKMLLYTIALCFTFGYLLPSVGLLLGKFFHLTLYKNIGIQGLYNFAGFYLIPGVDYRGFFLLELPKA